MVYNMYIVKGTYVETTWGQNIDFSMESSVEVGEKLLLSSLKTH